jgi:hypothetical protein
LCFFPALSVTTEQASNPSTDHGGGKRRGGHDYKQKPRYSNSAGLFCKAVKLFAKLNASRQLKPTIL